LRRLLFAIGGDQFVTSSSRGGCYAGDGKAPAPMAPTPRLDKSHVRGHDHFPDRGFRRGYRDYRYRDRFCHDRFERSRQWSSK
jgi:hypothetical protein